MWIPFYKWGNRTQLPGAGAATDHLERARSAWPENFRQDGYLAQINKGLLWLENWTELNRLRQEAEALIARQEG